MSAGERIWLTNEKRVQAVSLTDDRLQDALVLMRESFYTDEPPAKGVQLQSCPQAIDELEKLTVETYQDGATVVAVKDGRVLGVSFNKIQVASAPGDGGYFEDFKQNKCKTATAKEYVDCMIRMDAKKDVFEHYGVDKSLEVMFLAVCRTARCQGVGRLLVQASVEVARAMNLPLVSVIFTSRASQRIGQVLQWDQLVTVPMSEHVFQGTPYSVFTGEDQTQVLMAIRVL